MILAPIVLASRPIEDIGEGVDPTRFLAPYCLIGFAFSARTRDDFFEREKRSLELPDESFQFARRISAHQRGFASNASCEIELPGNGIVKAAIQICHIFPSRGRAAPEVGVCFLDLEPRSERQIERWVARLERKHNRLR